MPTVYAGVEITAKIKVVSKATAQIILDEQTYTYMVHPEQHAYSDFQVLEIKSDALAKLKLLQQIRESRRTEVGSVLPEVVKDWKFVSEIEKLTVIY